MKHLPSPIRMNNTVRLATYCLLSFLCVLTAFRAVLVYSVSRTFGAAAVFMGILGIITVGLLAFIMIAERKSPETIFLAIAIPACTAFTLFMLPNQVPDEIWHIYRVLDIFDDGSSMQAPVEIELDALPLSYPEYFACLSAPGQYSDVFIVNRVMDYPVILYLFPGLVCALGKVFSINPYILIIVGRLVNSAVFIAAGYWMIKLMPFAKPAVMIYLLNPMLIQQESSCSADAMVNVITLFFVSYFFYVYLEEQPTRKQFTILATLTVLLVFAKYIYVFLGLLWLLFIPRLSEQKRRMIMGGFAGLAALVIIVALFLPVEEESTAGYMIVLYQNPGNSISVIINTLYLSLEDYIEWFAGSALGPLAIPVWKPFIWIYYGTLFSAVFISIGETISLTGREKLVPIAIVVIEAVLLIASMRQWSIEVYQLYDSITGVQGRYFFPVAILLFLAGFNHKKYIVRENCVPTFACICALFLLSDMFFVVRYFI